MNNDFDSLIKEAGQMVKEKDFKGAIHSGPDNTCKRRSRKDPGGRIDT